MKLLRCLDRQTKYHRCLRHFLGQISQASDELKQAYELSQQFISMVKQRNAEQLDGWLKDVKEPHS